MTTRLSLRCVSKLAPGAVPLFDDVSFDVAAGERIALVSAERAAAAVLLAVCVGLEHPTSGEVLFDGEPVERPGPERAIVSARASLFPWLTARENIAYACSGRTHAVAPERWLALLGLEQRADCLPRELEPTERHGVVLARALAVQPRLLAVDEPVDGLDGFERTHWHELLDRALAAEPELAVLLAGHDEAAHAARVTRTLELRNGRVREAGREEASA